MFFRSDCFFLFYKAKKLTSLVFKKNVFKVPKKQKSFTKLATMKTLRPCSSTTLPQISTVFDARCKVTINFNFLKLPKFWPISSFSHTFFRDIVPQRWQFSFGIRGGGLFWTLDETDQKPIKILMHNTLYNDKQYHHSFLWK